MGNSTTTLVSLYDSLKAKGIFDPRDQPGGVGLRLALDIANDVMSEIIAERFNPKWNEGIAAPFLTNSYQQDYPQIGLTGIGWGTHVDIVDINNTNFPKPTNAPVTMTFVRDLARTSLALWPPNQICWKYNQDLSYGLWPGNGVIFNPLLTAGPVIQSPLRSMIDANGNLLIVTSPPNLSVTTVGPDVPPAISPTYGEMQYGGLVTLFVLGDAPPAWLVPGINLTVTISDSRLGSGTPVQVISGGTGYVIGGQTYYALAYVLPNTGTLTVPQEAVTANAVQYVGPPLLPNVSPEGTTFNDGTVQWTVVAPMSQGFRVFPLPGATGPVYQITPYYQTLLQKLTLLTQPINPVPDDQRYIYREGLENYCKRCSPNPQEKADGLKEYPIWIEKLAKLLKQNNREPDAYGAFPATQVVDSVYDGWRGLRNPQDPSQPY